MVTTEQKTKRQERLDQIMRRIATFVLHSTYTNEQEAQKHLSNALREIQEAQKLLVGE